MKERISIILLVVFLLVGTFFFHYAEEWSYTDSFYFSTITLTTIGYGDLYPSKDSSKIFVSFYALFGIGFVLYTLGSIIGESIVGHGVNLHKVVTNAYDSGYGTLLKDRKRLINSKINKGLMKRGLESGRKRW
ncbi:MAG: potassium channel family protein [Nanoarchaeota archaeon]